MFNEPRTDRKLSELITSTPDVMSGAVVFRGTRVPLSTLFVNLASGLTVEEILDAFPTLDRDDILAVLELSADALCATVRPLQPA